MAIWWAEGSLRRIVGGAALLALLGMVMPGGIFVRAALAEGGPTLADVRLDFIAGNYTKALEGAEAIIAARSVSGASLATCLAFKGRCLVHLGQEKEARQAFKEAINTDKNLAPNESWAQEEVRVFQEATQGGSKWWLFGLVAGGVTGIALLLFGGSTEEAPAPQPDLPIPPDPPGALR